MHLVQIFLPLFTRDDTAQPAALFAQVREEMVARFGGMTAYAQRPAEGVWKPDTSARAERDELVVYEVMVDDFDAAWWREYRAGLDRRFEQERVLVRAFAIQLI